MQHVTLTLQANADRQKVVMHLSVSLIMQLTTKYVPVTHLALLVYTLFTISQYIQAGVNKQLHHRALYRKLSIHDYDNTASHSTVT